MTVLVSPIKCNNQINEEVITHHSHFLTKTASTCANGDSKCSHHALVDDSSSKLKDDPYSASLAILSIDASLFSSKQTQVVGIIVKPFTGSTKFVVEANPTDTILQVKEKIRFQYDASLDS